MTYAFRLNLLIVGSVETLKFYKVIILFRTMIIYEVSPMLLLIVLIGLVLLNLKHYKWRRFLRVNIIMAHESQTLSCLLLGLICLRNIIYRSCICVSKDWRTRLGT